MDLFEDAQRGYRYQEGVSGRGLKAGRRMKYAVRLAATAPVLLSEWPAVLGRRGIRSSKSVRFMNDLCNATNGRGLDAGGSFVRLLRRRQTAAFDANIRGRLERESNISPEEVRRVVDQLRTDGFAVIRGFTSVEIATRIREGVESAAATDWERNNYRDFHEWSASGRTSRIDVDSDAVNAVVQGSGINLAGMDLIAREFLKSAPIRVPAQCWITHARGELTAKDLEETAMSYHCDSDFLSFFKTFLLLTPVSEDNGPFAFINGSHKGDRQVQGRVSDSNLGIGDGEVRLGVGQPGDLVLACTMGWHKGTPVREGHRSMVQWLYTTSLFGRATK